MSYLPKDYVPVHTRVQKAHDQNENLKILTQYELLGNDTVVFRATVTTVKGEFSGTSFGKLTKEKALEKLETVAVGRALAFAGYEIQSGLASKDEMDKFQDSKERFNDKQFNQLKKKIEEGKYKTYNDCIKVLEQNYKLSKKMKETITFLFKS